MKPTPLFILSVFLVFCNVNAQDSLSTKVPPEILFKKPTQNNFSISPDGKYFVEVVENNIEIDIVVIDIDSYSLFKRIPVGHTAIQNVYWLSSKRLIYESLGEIFAIDIDGTNATLIVDRMADQLTRDLYKLHENIRVNGVVNLLHSNKNEILIQTYDYSGYCSIKRVNIFTGQKITVIDGKYEKIHRWILDSEGNIRLGIRYNDTGYDYLVRSSKNNKWEQFYLKMDNQDIPLKIDATSYLSQNVNFEGFGLEEDIIYITTNLNSDKRQLISYDLAKEKVVDILVEDPNCDVNDPHGRDISFIYDFSNGDLAGIRFESIAPYFKWFSPKMSSYHASLNKKHPDYINDIIGSDSNGDRLLIHQWSDTNAGNIGVYKVKEDAYYVMFYFNEELNNYKLSKTKIVIAKARDDFRIPCYVTLPIHYSNSEPIPLVVIPHGGPWARDYWELDSYAHYFSNRGYATLRVNFRGSTGFGKEHVLSGVNSIDEVMINDIADATNFAIEKYNLDANSTFIFGHSYGGYAVYMSLLKYPDLYAKGVAVSAPSDIKAWLKTQKKEDNYFAYEFWNFALGSKKAKYLNEISPIHYAQDYKKPLLIFHGKNDEVISVEQAEEMFFELKKYNKDVKLEILQKEGHSILDSYSLGYILDASNDFFIQNQSHVLSD